MLPTMWSKSGKASNQRKCITAGTPLMVIVKTFYINVNKKYICCLREVSKKVKIIWFVMCAQKKHCIFNYFNKFKELQKKGHFYIADINSNKADKPLNLHYKSHYISLQK